MATSDLLGLVSGYTASVQAIRASIRALVLGQWRSLGTWHRKDVERFTALAVPTVLGAQRQVASLTAAYLARLVAELLGAAPRVAAVPQTMQDITAIRGVDPYKVYSRPFHQVWTDLGNGKPLDDALSDGAERAVNIAETDLQLAKTHAGHETLTTQDRVVGYRRVLEGPYSCGLCLVAATQRYKTSKLMPIHPACDCGIAPIIGDKDPGRTINAAIVVDGVSPASISESDVNHFEAADVVELADLPAVHDRIRERFGRTSASATGYEELLITHEHSELGPVLAVRGQHFKDE